MYKGIKFLAKIYWKHRKSALIYLGLYSILGALLPLVSIVMPKYILDELLGGQNIQIIALCVVLLLGSQLFGNTLVDLFQTRFFIGGSDIHHQFSLEMSRSLYEADLEHIESPEFLDLEETAKRFLYADGYGFGGVLQKAANILSEVIALGGIISIIAHLNLLIVVILVGISLLTSWQNFLQPVDTTLAK